MRHPNLPYVQDLLQSILEERRLRGWALQGLEFDVMRHEYKATCNSKEGIEEIIVFRSEFVDEVEVASNSFPRRKIKRLFKESFRKHDPDWAEEENDDE